MIPRALVLLLPLLSACSPAIRADEQETDKPLLVVAAKDAEGAEIQPAPAPTIPPGRPVTTPSGGVVTGLGSAGAAPLAPSAGASASAPR